MLNSLLYARGDTERFDYKINRNTNKRINIVTMIASRIIEVIKLINNELNKNELVSLILLYEYYREIL